MKNNKQSFYDLSDIAGAANNHAGRRTFTAAHNPAFAVGLPIDGHTSMPAQHMTPYAGFAAVAQPGAAAAEEAANATAKRASPSENELNDANKRSSPSPATPF